MERQFSWRECVENVGIPSSVHLNQLEDSVCKIFEKLNCNVTKDNLEDCHHLKGHSVIVKFSKRKDCKQLLSVWLTLALREIACFILIKAYYLTTKCCVYGLKR